MCNKAVDLSQMASLLSNHLMQQDATNRAKASLDKLNAASTRTEYNPDNPDQSQLGWSVGKGTASQVPVSPTDPNYMSALGEYGIENPQGAQFQFGLQKERMPQVIQTPMGGTTNLYDPQTQTTKEIAKGSDMGSWKQAADGSMAFFPRNGNAPTISDVKGPEKSPSLLMEWRKEHPFEPIENFINLQNKNKGGAGTFFPIKDASGAVLGYANPKSKETVSLEEMGLGPAPTPLTAQGRNSKESAGIVTGLIDDAMKMIDKVDLGPLAGRWQDLMQGKIGAENPEFAALQTQFGLLQSKLAQMHTGSRGAIAMVKKFEDMANQKTQTAGNLKAQLNTIRKYVQDVAKEGESPNPFAPKKAIVPTQSTAPVDDPLGILK